MKIKYNPNGNPVITTHWRLELAGSRVADLLPHVDATIEGMREVWKIKSHDVVQDDGKAHIYFVLEEKRTNEFTKDFMRQLQEHEPSI